MIREDFSLEKETPRSENKFKFEPNGNYSQFKSGNQDLTKYDHYYEQFPKVTPNVRLGKRVNVKAEEQIGNK